MLLVVVFIAGCAHTASKSSKDTKTTDSSKLSTYTLKESFEKSREEENVAISLTKFWNANIHVVTKQVGPDKYDYYYTSSPKPGRRCVTVSENLENLKSINSTKQAMQGNQLIRSIEDDVEIVIVYDKGGDYISHEQLKWIKEQVSN